MEIKVGDKYKAKFYQILCTDGSSKATIHIVADGQLSNVVEILGKYVLLDDEVSSDMAIITKEQLISGFEKVVEPKNYYLKHQFSDIYLVYHDNGEFGISGEKDSHYGRYQSRFTEIEIREINGTLEHIFYLANFIKVEVE